MLNNPANASKIKKPKSKAKRLWLIGGLGVLLFIGLTFIVNRLHKSKRLDRLPASFGYSMAIDDQYLAIGTPFLVEELSALKDDNPPMGAIYIFKRSNNQWLLDDKLSVADETLRQQLTNDNQYSITLGFSLALGGDRLVSYTDIISDRIAVFKRAGDKWTLEQVIDNETLKLPESEENTIYTSMSLDNNRLLLIRNHYDDPHKSNAYILKLANNTWELDHKITAKMVESHNPTPEYTPHLRRGVLANGQLALHYTLQFTDEAAAEDQEDHESVIYIFNQTAKDWDLVQIITDDDPNFNDLDFSEFSSLAFSGDHLVIGAPGPEDVSRGMVYILGRLADGTYELEQTLSQATPGLSGLQIGNRFGYKIDLADNYLTVTLGCQSDLLSANQSDTVYLFKRIDQTWVLQQQFTHENQTVTDPAAGDDFVCESALSPAYLVFSNRVGLYEEDRNAYDEAIYIIKNTNDNWQLEQTFKRKEIEAELKAAGKSAFILFSLPLRQALSQTPAIILGRGYLI